MASSQSPFSNTGKLQVLPTQVGQLKTNLILKTKTYRFRQHYYTLNRLIISVIQHKIFAKQIHKMGQLFNNPCSVEHLQVLFGLIKHKISLHLKLFGQIIHHNYHQNFNIHQLLKAV
jgi:hypothetical protein